MSNYSTVYILLITCLFSTLPSDLFAQGCCSAGSGSPIAGGAFPGVLEDGQMEVSTSYRYISTNKFVDGDKSIPPTLDNYSTKFMYSRVGYGLNEDLTIFVESGYYLDQREITLNAANTLTSKGISDLIIFPRCNVYNKANERSRTSLTVGLGYKIPVGKYNDSAAFHEPFSGQTYYFIKPPSVQPSTGSHDLIINAFLFRGYPLGGFNVFANLSYVKKGWNPKGEKFGDFASAALFASKTLYVGSNSLGLMLQARYEWIDQMKLNKTVLLYNYPNYDWEATSSQKVFITPQLNFTVKKLTFFLLSDIPVYQYAKLASIVSQHQYTGGVSYKFLLPKKAETL